MSSNLLILFLFGLLFSSLIAEKTCNCDEEETLFCDQTAEWSAFYSPVSFDCANNQSCSYKIAAPEGYHLIIDVPFYRSQPHPNRIYIYDGDKLLEEMSGYGEQKITAESKGNEVTMIFERNEPISKRRFKIAYMAVENEPQRANRLRFLGITLAWMAVFVLLALFVLYKSCRKNKRGSYRLWPYEDSKNSLIQETSI